MNAIGRWIEPTPGAVGEWAAPAAREYSGAEVICAVLKAHGVRTVFGYAGGAILHLYDALHRDADLYHVTVRHEQGAAHAAAGYARRSGRPGVCITTSGPGATNLLTGIMDAHMDSTPLVVICGQVDSRLIGSDAFQETDVLAVTAPVSKHGFQPRHPDEVAPMLHAAFHIAASGRPGPVVVDVPKDVLTATTRQIGGRLALPGYRAPGPPDPAAIAAVAAELRAAARPLLLLGGGALSAAAGPVVRALAERLGLHVVTTINAKGVMPERHPLAHGIIGMYGRKSGVWGLMHADLVLAFGCRFTDRITGAVAPFAAGKRVVQVDVDAYELGKNVPAAITIQADARVAAERLLAVMAGDGPSPAQRAWGRQLQAARAVCERCVPHVAAAGVHPKAVMEALNRVRRPHDVVTTGVGQHQMFASHFLVCDEPRTFISSCGAGTMGFGLPAAIGAGLATPGARVFVVDGDGSFQMTSQELATVAQERLPIVVLVLDNGQLGMVRQWQDRVYGGRHAAVRFDDRPGHPDFVLLARAYGIEAAEVRSGDALDAALDAAVARPGPTLLRIAVDPAVDNLPMMPAGTDYGRYYGNCVAEPGQLFGAGELPTSSEAAHD